MANIIDKQTEDHSYALGAERISTTLTLIETNPGKFAMDYEFVYSGIRNGNSTSATPISVNANCTVTANADPKVVYTISNYSDSGTHISMQITITIDVAQLGTKTVFDKTLGGKYGADNLQAMIKHITEISRK